MNMTDAPIMPRVCDSCTDAVLQEAEEVGLDLDWTEAAGYARELGADIADHICDARESDRACGCACRRYDATHRRH